jgi:hypothetical protein
MYQRCIVEEHGGTVKKMLLFQRHLQLYCPGCWCSGERKQEEGPLGVSNDVMRSSVHVFGTCALVWTRRPSLHSSAMLKLWKRTWRGTSEGTAPSPSPGPPDDDEPIGQKRRREDSQDSESERPLKQGKTDITESVPIQNILPEIEAGTGQISNVSELRAAVLEMAKRTNSKLFVARQSVLRD